MGIASLFHPKARKWVEGRRNIFDRLQRDFQQKDRVIWMHCASLGEFEQGRPIIEKLRVLGTGHKILLTFFSPSGYEAQKNYKGADWVYYLPMDGPSNARRFLEITRPVLVIFIKYELWYYYLKKIKYRDIPLLLVSAYFRKGMSFFKWYGMLPRKMLSRFHHVFVQDHASKRLLDEIGLGTITEVSGDTRFDRVIEIAEKFHPVPDIDAFIGSGRVIVAGSTWPQDEEALQEAWKQFDDPGLRLIIAPHEIGEEHLQQIEKSFPASIRYSTLRQTSPPHERVLLIDNIGMLSRLYKYSTISFIGGGFTRSGIHNVLEAAVYGKPVIVGPNYRAYREAVELVQCGGAMTVSNANGLFLALEELLRDGGNYERRSGAAHEYVWVNKGATDRVIRYIQENRLLTS